MRDIYTHHWPKKVTPNRVFEVWQFNCLWNFHQTDPCCRGCHWNTCKLIFTIIHTQIPGLMFMSMWMHLFQMILHPSLTEYVSTALTTCVRWWYSLVPMYTHWSSHNMRETTQSTTHCECIHRLSSSSHVLFLHTILNMTDRCIDVRIFVHCLYKYC